jgi:ATP-binding protein involved in chromosome partitioning
VNQHSNYKITKTADTIIVSVTNEEDIAQIKQKLVTEYPHQKIVFHLDANNSDKLFKKVILVSSGKGGVGKSSLSVNIAYQLRKMNKRVGLFDADIYGPSIPHMLGIAKRKLRQNKDKTIEPIIKDNIVVASIGFMLKDDDALIWRGPMIMGAIKQLVEDVAWPQLDYLVVDMPPGTGDAHLSIAKILQPTGAIIITTPQNIAVLDAKKVMNAYDKLNIPIIGILENMSYYQCPKCGNRDQVFADNGGKKLAKQYKTKLLGQLPLNATIRKLHDNGKNIIMHGDKLENATKVIFNDTCKEIINY